jgi:hypothetical protein
MSSRACRDGFNADAVRTNIGLVSSLAVGVLAASHTRLLLTIAQLVSWTSALWE